MPPRPKGNVKTVTTVTKPPYSANGKSRRYNKFSSGRNYSVSRTGGSYNQVIRGSQGAEKKYLDVNLPVVLPTLAKAAGTGGNTSGTQNQILNACQLGTDATQRIGRKIVMRSILMRYIQTLQDNAGATDPIAGATAGSIRVMIVLDMQANGTALTVADVLVGAGGTANVAGNNLNNRERFRVLFDKFRVIDPSGPRNVMFKCYKKINIPVQFNGGNAGTIGDIQTGALWWLAMSTIDSTANGNIGGEMFCRVRFDDP